MKKRTLFTALFLVLVMLFVSCANSIHRDGDDGIAPSNSQAVKVSLCLGGDVQTSGVQKAVAINASADDLSYYIQTTALWTGSNIQNPYPSLTEITYSDNMELGYFSPGSWTFYVEIRNGANVIYKGTNTPVYISTSTKAVSVEMNLATDGGAVGSVVLKIAVPKANANAPDVTYSYSGAASGSGRVNTTPTVDTTVNTSGVTSASDNWYYFTKTLNDLVPGKYVLVLNYLDENEGNRIGGTTVSFTVRNGDAYGVYGTIEEGEYQIATLLLVMPTITLSLSGSETAAKHPTETATITATASAGATFTWYVNGTLQGGQTGSTYALSRAVAGRFVVTCVATSSDGKLSKHASHIIRVLP